MDVVADEGILDVDILPEDGSEDEGDVPPSSELYGAASTPTSCASSPRGEEPASPHAAASQPAFFHHQPYARPFFTSARRGPGRPRKEGVKLTREGKQVRRYRTTPGSVRGAKRQRGSRDEALDEAMDEDDFTMPAPEEPPYFPEKWPGKLCALCNLNERSQLGQGEMRQFLCDIGEPEGGSAPPSVPSSGNATPTNVQTPLSAPPTPIPPGLGSPPPELLDPNQHPLAIPLSRRQKGFNKTKTPLYNLEHTDELSIIGHIEVLELPAVVTGQAFYIHRNCLEFSPPVQECSASPPGERGERGERGEEDVETARARALVSAALTRKCAFCQRHGASLPCKPNCNKYFHLPCVLASGGILDFPSKAAYCKDHLYQVPLECKINTATGGLVDCRVCRVVGDLANLMTCVVCGDHYHGTCVGLAQLPGVRAGWACRGCRGCQVCRGEADGRCVACEACDKLYHAACLRPAMATVPKYGWKCKCCRVCSDCGARSPGAGPSSRWHAHYTVCDSCYQQRNKGCCCPLCRRAYRAAAMRDMTRCRHCRRYVHGSCDPDADPATYRARKEAAPTYEYCCPICKANAPLTGSKPISFDEDSMTQSSQDSCSFEEANAPPPQDPLAIDTKMDVGLGKGKPFTVSSKIAKKKIAGYKLKGGYSSGKVSFQKRQRSLEFGRKRGSKPKMRGMFGVPGLGLQRPQAPDNKTADDDPGVENKLILCSSKDKFMLTQDLCVMCGAVGTDSEGCLIACSQCGQTYHPYCVSVKISAVIVSLGWRCLECTVCEGCGSRGDDALLVLCDECDTARHTYCARPPLPAVPRGAWRCRRCRSCTTCGQDADYTECGACASLVSCGACGAAYSAGQPLRRCVACRRWGHAACGDATGGTFRCTMCAGRPPPAGGGGAAQAGGAGAGAGAGGARPAAPTAASLGLAGEYVVDNVCLSQHGAHHIKTLEAELGITHTRRKRRFKHDDHKDIAAQAPEVEDDSKPDNTADVKEEPGTNTSYKDGQPWSVLSDGPAPEGFTLFTLESGATVLRRKRQRNLTKLGIGGFVVRQRSTNKSHQEDDDLPPQGESPSNKRKGRRKPRSRLMEQLPPYMQEAFFGKELAEPTAAAAAAATANNNGNYNTTGESPCGDRGATPDGWNSLKDLKIDSGSETDDDEVLKALAAIDVTQPGITIDLTQEEVELLNSLKPKEEAVSDLPRVKEESAGSGGLTHTADSTALRDAILGPAAQPEINAAAAAAVAAGAALADALPDVDVHDIFKGVLTDDSQESQESSGTCSSAAAAAAGFPRAALHSPMEYAHAYHNDYSSGSAASQLSPAFSEGAGGGGRGVRGRGRRRGGRG